MGLGTKTSPPPSDICQFCGKVMPRKGLVIGNDVCMWQPFPMRCDCDRAREYWRKYDEAKTERRQAEAEAERRAAIQGRIDSLLGQSGIKKRFRRRTFDNFVTDTQGRKEAYETAKAYAYNFAEYKANGDGIYIEGTNGTGKTHLAVAIALKLIYEDKIPVICKTAGDLLLDIKRTFNDNSTVDEAQVLDIYKQVDLLIIDDLGKEQCSDWSMSMLYSILNDRYEEMRPTIITTNYNAVGLIKALTPKGCDDTKVIAVLSRLKETSIGITMDWEDWRGRKENI